MEKIQLQEPDTIEDWFDRLDLLMATDKKYTSANATAHLLTFAGAEAYSLVKQLAFPRKPKDLTIEEIKKMVVRHVVPVNLEIT